MGIELGLSDDSKYLKMPRSPRTGEAKWKDIEDLINRWARRNPKGARELEQWIKSTKEGLYDKKYAKLSNEGMGNGRLGVMIHPELMQYIEAFYPGFLGTKDELHEFMRRFRKFTVSEEV